MYLLWKHFNFHDKSNGICLDIENHYAEENQELEFHDGPNHQLLG